MRRRRRAGCALLIAAGLAAPARAEVCRFEGTTSYAGRVQVRVATGEAAGLLTVDVTARLQASPWRLWDVQFLAQETSTWRAGVLQSVAVNGRYLVNGRPRRQQWDVFAPGREPLRAQAKTESDFRKRYPAFLWAWDPSRFALPWLAAFPIAEAERRPDLDMARPADTRTPFALAFHWVRSLPPGPLTVFLPGWKRDAFVPETVTAVPGGLRMSLQHPAVGPGPAWAEVMLTPDRHIGRIRFEIHAPAGDGDGTITATGCE